MSLELFSWELYFWSYRPSPSSIHLETPSALCTKAFCEKGLSQKLLFRYRWLLCAHPRPAFTHATFYDICDSCTCLFVKNIHRCVCFFIAIRGTKDFMSWKFDGTSRPGLCLLARDRHARRFRGLANIYIKWQGHWKFHLPLLKVIEARWNILSHSRWKIVQLWCQYFPTSYSILMVYFPSIMYLQKPQPLLTADPCTFECQGHTFKPDPM